MIRNTDSQDDNQKIDLAVGEQEERSSSALNSTVENSSLKRGRLGMDHSDQLSLDNPSDREDATSSSTPLEEHVYHDYAQEEDPTGKINANYARHSSLITHEDETTKSLTIQKLPSKLAAMLSDPGE